MDQTNNLPPFPEKDLFIETKSPNNEQPPAKKESAVRQFLNKNHFLDGLAAGYEMHCHDGLTIYVKELRAKFRDAVDIVLAGFQQELANKQIILMQIGEMLPSQKQCLEVSIKQLQDLIEESKLQKVLSVDGEGWISSALDAFEKGYQKGMVDYLNEKDFFSQTNV